MISYILRVVCSAQRLTLNAARLARPILGTVQLGQWSEAQARGRFPGARALWKVASLLWRWKRQRNDAHCFKLIGRGAAMLLGR